MYFISFGFIEVAEGNKSRLGKASLRSLAVPLSLLQRNGSVERVEKMIIHNNDLPSWTFYVCAHRLRTSSTLPLIGFEGIYAAPSSQMLHALGMTSFRSPHSPSDPLHPCLGVAPRTLTNRFTCRGVRVLVSPHGARHRALVP